MRRRPVSDRFWEKVNRDGPIIKEELGPCWPWIGATDKDGYGRFYLNKDKPSEPAYRVAYILEYGPLGKGYEPDHLCEHRPCCRPSHMEAVTSFVNNSRGHKGKEHPMKLTRVQVEEIRGLYASGNYSQQKIAEEFGVSQPTVSAIVLNQIWNQK